MAHLPQLAAIERDFPLTVSELITLGGWREFGAFRSPGVRSSAYGVGRGDGGLRHSSDDDRHDFGGGAASERCSHG